MKYDHDFWSAIDALVSSGKIVIDRPKGSTHPRFPHIRYDVDKREHCVCQKQHGMRYTQLRGLARVTSQLTHLFASMNLKKLATWKDKNGLLWRLEKLFMIIKGYFREPKVPFLSTG